MKANALVEKIAFSALIMLMALLTRDKGTLLVVVGMLLLFKLIDITYAGQGKDKNK